MELFEATISGISWTYPRVRLLQHYASRGGKKTKNPFQILGVCVCASVAGWPGFSLFSHGVAHIGRRIV